MPEQFKLRVKFFWASFPKQHNPLTVLCFTRPIRKVSSHYGIVEDIQVGGHGMVTLEAIPDLGGLVNGQERQGAVVVGIVQPIQVGLHVLALVTKGHTPVPRLEGRRGRDKGLPQTTKITPTSMKSLLEYRT